MTVFIIIIIAIIGYVVYIISHNGRIALQREIESHGGMLNKYQTLVTYLTSYPNATVQEVQKNKIHIYSDLNIIGSTMNFYIIEMNQSVNIQWTGFAKNLGKHSQNWNFSKNYPQEKMFQQINEDMNSKMDQILGNR